MNVNTTSSNPTIIPGSTRPDGTRRPDIKVKPGYTPQEMVPSYVIPQKQGQTGPNESNPSTSTGKEPQHKDPGKEQLQQIEYNLIPGMDPDMIKQLKEQEEKKKSKKRVRVKKKKILMLILKILRRKKQKKKNQFNNPLKLKLLLLNQKKLNLLKKNRRVLLKEKQVQLVKIVEMNLKLQEMIQKLQKRRK